ncbi:MarR family transcriptional regulator [Wenjunlia vitaminophila]|uniref:MarR family transcriptional regulator n=1 Tax=Wenjunlia vitaminophila TaxID=76728 RepID=A0A0T6LNY7_WENVI|nr:helix-turn-helix domain-containing GNAT family N-acetyltransferase [Wenjunlia vitaminophila]KRV47815.1 MarR family transcriptional regulator [Wenjunlia vitaminophila]
MTVAIVREFNRYYTRVIGALDYESHLGTPYSLTEARVLYELARREVTEVPALRSALSLDAGYLSRLLGRFEERGLVVRERSASDARRQLVRLTASGREEAALLDHRSEAAVSGLLATLSPADRARLTAGMRTVSGVLQGAAADRPRGYLVREPAPGDIGWVIHRHGAVYAAEYGWNGEFEALVARIATEFAERRDPRRERAWIAEVDGEPAGSVFAVRGEQEGVALLRLLLVEPRARGLGVGGRLVEECVAFARAAGYRELRLFTMANLHAAHRIYRRAGFVLESSTPCRAYGKELESQDWRLPL